LSSRFCAADGVASFAESDLTDIAVEGENPFFKIKKAFLLDFAGLGIVR
jgi:hypothetical protein